MPYVLTADAGKGVSLCVCADDGSTPVWDSFADALSLARAAGLERATPEAVDFTMRLERPQAFSEAMTFDAARRELRMLLTARGRRELGLGKRGGTP